MRRYGGVSIDFRDMNRVLDGAREDLDCVVEPGITRKQLNEQLRDSGLFFPIDPGADASLGGMAATRASGTNAVRYGTMKDNVIALKVVLANGEVIDTARRAKKTAAGYDLTRLMVGSEGTLGVITELTLKLSGIPEAIAGGTCPFPSVEACCNTAIHDHPVRHSGGAHRTARRAAGARLQSVFQARPAGDADAVPRIPRHARRRSPSSPSVSARSRPSSAAVPSPGRRKPEERTKLWEARHHAALSNFTLRPGAQMIATDVCVPISRLAECVTETQADIAASRSDGADRRPCRRRQFPSHLADRQGRRRRGQARQGPVASGWSSARSPWTAPAPASTASARAR